MKAKKVKAKTKAKAKANTKVEPKKEVATESSDSSYLYKAYRLASDYFFNAENRLYAWMLLIGTILCIVALVGLTAAFSWWAVGFWAALMAKEFSLVLISTGIFAAITTAYVGINSLKNYLMETLSIHWRNWMTQNLVDKYLSGETNYLDLKRQPDQIENPEQRIQEDVKSFVDETLSLGLYFLRSVITLGTFIGTLWIVGGSLTFVAFGATLVIPGFLVWVAIAIAIVTSVITHYIGSSLSEYKNKQRNLEADYRKEMQTLSNDAESIAQEKGVSYYQNSLKDKLNDISENYYDSRGVKTRLSAFQDFCMQLPSILPYIAAAPLFFAGQIDLGQLSQIAMAFDQVNNSLGFFVNMSGSLAKYKASVERLSSLVTALDEGLQSTKKGILVTQNELQELSVNKLDIAYPSSTKLIMRGLTLKFPRGVDTVINGQSGMGKSTLFKVIAGSWRYGDGQVNVPSHDKMCFLPQKPVLPHNTLKAVLAYPDKADLYTDDQCIKVLKAVENMNKFISQLHKKRNWSTLMSAGEQQRISFARALLRKPEWLFLDEATASLDPKSEQHLYRLLKRELKNTTIFSIAHREKVKDFHDRIITLESDGEDMPIRITEQRVTSSAHGDAANSHSVKEEDSSAETTAAAPSATFA